jgi:hypothetical protein
MGRPELPGAAARPLGVGRTRLLPLALMTILSIGMPVLLPGTRPTLPTVGIVTPRLVLTVVAIPAVSMATRLLPVTLSVIPAIGMATGLLPAMRLAMPAIRKGARLGPLVSLTIHLSGRGTVRSRLGCQRAQYHTQTHREHNAPPFS